MLILKIVFWVIILLNILFFIYSVNQETNWSIRDNIGVIRTVGDILIMLILLPSLIIGRILSIKVRK